MATLEELKQLPSKNGVRVLIHKTKITKLKLEEIKYILDYIEELEYIVNSYGSSRKSNNTTEGDEFIDKESL